MGHTILHTCLLMTITAATADSLDANLGRERGAGTASTAVAGPPRPTREPLVKAVDLSIGESRTVALAGGNTATVKLLAVDERRDPVRSAVREATVRVEVNGETVTLASGNCLLPVAAGRVQLDCPITRGYRSHSTEDPWGLVADARIRLWPADSPWIEPASFAYPARQRWYASMTQMANEPVYADGGDKPGISNHRFDKPGDPLVRVERTDRRNVTATAQLHLVVEGVSGKAEPPSGWKAGVARVDITPTKPVRMAGYASRTSPSQGVAHPLFGKALALAGPNGHKVVIVTCDIIALRRNLCERAARRVESQHGLARADLVFFASHTHSGPQLIDPDEPGREGMEANAACTRDLEDKIVGVVGSALTGMKPVSLTYGVGRAHFALNRREPTPKGIKLGKYPAGPTDESVPILRVRSAEGNPLAVVFGYACHNTTLRPDMTKIDPDYAGYAQDRVEADNPGAVAMFVTGCAGDADPHPFGTLEMARSHGEELAAAVKFVLDHDAWSVPISGSLRTAFIETTIHFAGPTDRASFEKLLGDSNTARQRHARRMIEAIDAGRPIRTEYPHYSVQALALGDGLTMVALSGEVVVDYAIRLQNELGGEGRSLWVAAYANDVIGYIPSVRVLKEGGYEGGESFYGSTWPTPFATDIEPIVVRAAHDAVRKVREK